MSDHIDGPRSIGDPASDLTDLFVFTNPRDPRRTVIVVDVFPAAGDGALLSNAVTYAAVVRPARVAGLGEAAKFTTADPEVRFSLTFENLEPGAPGRLHPQRGLLTAPGGETIALTLNDEAGAASADGALRVFVGLRSDPFFIGWVGPPIRGQLRQSTNLVEHDNILAIVLDFETARFLNHPAGTLWGAIAETTIRGQLSGVRLPRLDWVGRPEQTNFRINRDNSPELRDIWNQQTPFSIGLPDGPVLYQRILDSLLDWDVLDGRRDWPPALLAASANVYFDDFLLFDSARPIDDLSFFEIEKSTIAGAPYRTGGGRTLGANVIDNLVTWMINRDTGKTWASGVTRATQPANEHFPYVPPPNRRQLSVTKSVRLAAAPGSVWALIGDFGAYWHPLIASIEVIGTGPGELRKLGLIDGKRVIERLESADPATRVLTYTMIDGLPVADYTATITVAPDGGGSIVTWAVRYRTEGTPDVYVKVMIEGLLGAGLRALAERFGAVK